MIKCFLRVKGKQTDGWCFTGLNSWWLLSLCSRQTSDNTQPSAFRLIQRKRTVDVILKDFSFQALQAFRRAAPAAYLPTSGQEKERDYNTAVQVSKSELALKFELQENK